MAGEMAPSGSRRSWLSGGAASISRSLRDPDDPFRRSAASRDGGDDEENLRWAALEKLPTYDRMRRGIIRKVLDDGNQYAPDEVDIANLESQLVLHWPMASNVDLADRFDVSGPKHMMSRAGAGSSPMMIDWDNEEHRRCIAACIVKGTYVIEHDRTRCRMHTKALAPAWWESFHFGLVDVLKDDSDEDDQFVFGAIYKHVPPAGARHHPSAPHFVVAFRGTMLLHPNAIQDLYLDFKIMANTLPDSKRSRRAHLAVDTLMATIAKGGAAGPDSCIVWLTGHSLGASLALDVGRAMMEEKGLCLPAFLFNPPQVSPAPAINVLRPTEVAKRDLYATSYFVKAGLGLVLKPHRKRMEMLFERLSPWAPELYVHERDVICQGFVDYFEQRQLVEERFGGVAKSAMTLSYRDMLFSVLGKEKKRPHLLPSATLWKNSSVDGDAHGLQQWWKPDGELRLSARRYSWPGA